MSRLTKILILILFVFIFSNIFVQAQDTSAVSMTDEPISSGTTGDVVDLTETAIEIKLEPERPLVQIMSVRLKPEFDDVNLEKSFIPELLGKGEQITVREDKTSEEEEIIDSEKVPFPPEFAFWLGYWCAVTSMTLKELDRKNLE